jgi:hypothetical protein
MKRSHRMTEFVVALGPADTVGVKSIEYNMEHKNWWVTTCEERFIHRDKLMRKILKIYILGRGHGATIEEALKNAGEDHLKKRANKGL